MKNHTTAIAAACEKAGGQNELAKILRVSASYVNQLIKNKRPIPANHCSTIDTRLGISRKLLRPDDWQDIWPELAADSSNKP
jgi:DNA-binding transcriptional regulator YdaS (Cro superfamily)